MLKKYERSLIVVLGILSFTGIIYSAQPKPSVPVNLTPTNNGIDVSLNIPLHWSSSRAQNYDIYFGTANPPPLAVTRSTSTSYSVSTLNNTNYFWKIVARNKGGLTTSPVWTFRTVGSTPIPIPPAPSPSDTYGPDASVVCGVSDVSIPDGGNIQTYTNNNSAGTHFCLAAATFTIAASITPKSGNVYTCTYGAVIDGNGWSSSDTTAAAFRAHNENITSVTVSNCEIKRMPQQGIHACGNQCSPNNTGWVIDHNYIHHNKFAVQVGSNAVIRHNLLTDNSAASGNSGAYNIGFADNIEVNHNEIARNGAETKFGDTTRVWFHDNWVHDQTYNGTWLDGCDDTGVDSGHYSIIEDNTYEDIPIFSIFIEISRFVIVRNNIILRSGWAGIQLGTSHDVTVGTNTITTASGGVYAIQLRVDCGRQDFGVLDYDLKNNTIQSNTVTGDYSGSITALIIDQSLTTCSSDYVTNVKQNNWITNSYIVSNISASIFAWGINPPSGRTFTSWKALPQDTAGTIAVP